jgi:hypothetical protein
MTQFIGIRSEGGLIPYDILEKIAREEEGFGQQAKSFGLPSGRRLTDEISRAWSDAQDYWHIFQRRSENLPEDETGTTLTRKWVSDLLNELLGYDLTYQPTGAVVGGKNYPISHRAGDGEQSPPVHIEGFRIDIDRRLQGRRMSSQALVQEYLNNSDGHLWGIVTNGTLFRLLRDTSRTSRPSFLEFDLQSILDGNRFNEFSLFYRVCHRSRLPKTAEDSTSCWLEKYFQISIEQGGRVRDKLRDGVEDALKRLGTGFLQHPQNGYLRERVTSGNLTAAEFHRQLLRLVYRLLFLMVAEERRMIVPEAPDSERRQRLYDNYYSIARLRNLAEASIEQSKFGDLWIGMQQTFRLFEDAADPNPLGIPPLNGDLFSNIAVKDIQDTHLYNDDLLYSIHRLSLFDERRALQRVNYRDLDVEELGSVYESLLDYQPVFVPEAEGTRFDLRTGSERKSTGSYYTRPELVRELIESALVPVMQDRLDAAKDGESKQKAILSLSVCDPACGSGHFLLAAARRLGRELARVRSGEDEPTPKEFHLAVRDVIAHCIYGVDLNPLAADLCKLALWLEGHWTGKPLSFLDHRIKLGNSLVGVLDMKVLEEGIPDEAFTPVSGDDKKVASAFKKRNKDERKGQATLQFDSVDHVHHFAKESVDLISIEEDTPADVRRKKEAYEKSRQKPDWWHDWVAANLWTAAFFSQLTQFDDSLVPTYERFMTFLRGRQVDPRLEGAAIALATELRFFHWQLEFPEVFQSGGFDVVVGNPPWDSLQPEELAFFAAHGDGEIAKMSGAKRKTAIAELKRDNPNLLQQWNDEKRRIETAVKFIRVCGQLSLTTGGKLNTYSLFAELSTKLYAAKGFAGVLVPSGIFVDETNGQFSQELIGKGSLQGFYDFENREKLFSAVDSRMRFSLLTMSRKRNTSPQVAFYLTRTEQISDPRRRFTLKETDVQLFNPVTGVLPIFRTVCDYALTRKVYERFGTSQGNPINTWHITLRQGLFNMTSDSHLFADAPRQGWVPLYEGKMVQAYDDRAASIIINRANIHRQAQPDITSELQHADPNYRPTPHYWVDSKDVERGLGHWKKRWLMAFKDVTAATNERTAIGTIIPRVGAGHNLPLILFDETIPTSESALLLANLNSLPFDFIVRQKLASNHLTFGIFRQLPFLPRGTYRTEDESSIRNCVLELIYTSNDLRDWAIDAGFDSGCFGWNEIRRASLRAEIDAYFAHLYSLTHDELRYILDPKDVFGQDFPGETFRVLKEHEESEYGEYRTRRLVLEAFERLAESPRFRDEMSSRVSSLSTLTAAGERR